MTGENAWRRVSVEQHADVQQRGMGCTTRTNQWLIKFAWLAFSFGFIKSIVVVLWKELFYSAVEMKIDRQSVLAQYETLTLTIFCINGFRLVLYHHPLLVAFLELNSVLISGS